jgi:hypothetical protein
VLLPAIVLLAMAGPADQADPWARLPEVLARITPPRFPARECRASQHGCRGDGRTDCTEAIRKAITACHAAGGGRVVVPTGDVATGAIRLRSNVELHVPAGATLRFSTDPARYLPVVLSRWEGMELMNYSPLVYAYEEENIAVTGAGTLDGQADADHWWPWKTGERGHPNQKPDRDQLFRQAEAGVPVAERVYGGGHYLRPPLLQVYRSRNVLVEGVTFKNSPFWVIHPVLSTNVTVRKVTVVSHGPNNDGCNPESSTDVLIEDTLFDTGDDCIAIKSGRNADGRRLATPSSNIVVRGCRMKAGHGGVTIGSEVSGGVRGVWAERCQMSSPELDRALRIKTNAMRGGVVEDVFLRDIAVGEVKRAAIEIDMLYEEGDDGPYPPTVRNVQVERMTVDRAPHALWVDGLSRAPVRGLVVRDSRFSGLTKGSHLVGVGDLQLQNVAMEPAAPAPVSAVPESYPWTPDLGDGTFRNPVVFADYSDPDVIRVGDDFWMTASSFNCTPGLPILHSRDLVSWTLVNHALRRVPGAQYDRPQHGCGVWAPALRHHDGRFWIFFPTPDEGIYVTTASDPRGEWSPPRMVVAGKGLIDPCPLWDEDGKAYLVHAYANSRAGIKHKLRVRPMAPDGSSVLGEGQIVFDDPARHPTLEGPKFLKKDGWYYILAPAGGVPTGWQVALRSRSVYGPYEDRIVLERGSTPVNGPHQGALVDLPGGEWWFLHFQERQPYGRIVHLQPAGWKDGWPHMGIDRDGNGVGEPVLRHRKPAVAAPTEVRAPQTTDEFAEDRLGLQWQWHANSRDEWASLSARPGWLRLPSVAVEGADLAAAPNLLLQKLPAAGFVASTRMEASLRPGEQAGLAVVGTQHAALVLRQRDASTEIAYLVNGREERVEPWPHAGVHLRVTLQPGGECRFGYSVDGRAFRSLALPFVAREGKWIGAKVGVFAMSAAASSPPGHADFDYFRFSPLR